MVVRRVIAVAGMALLVSGGCGVAESPETVESNTSVKASGYVPDLEAAAKTLATGAVRVKEGDLVLIAGGVRDAELLENIGIEVRRQGAFPLVRLSSPRAARRYFDVVPAKYDAQMPAWEKLLTENIDVQIMVDASESDDLFADVSPERMQATAEAMAPLGLEAMRRGVRAVEVGNGLYPTATRAQNFGMPQDELARVFWEAVNADPTTLATTASKLKALLEASRQVRITHPNGTDVTLSVAGQKVVVNDGSISADDEKAAGANLTQYLPAGEVYLTIAPGSANGRLVADRYWHQGKSIEGLTLDIANGRVTNMTAKSGLEPLQQQYAAAGTGRDVVGVIDFGINPAIPAGADARVLTWVPAGMVTLAIGNNVWAGGTNNVAFGLSPFLPGSTVAVDGRTIVERGVLKL